MELARVETLVTTHYLVRHFSCAAACGEENTFVRDPLPTPLNGLPEGSHSLLGLLWQLGIPGDPRPFPWEKGPR
uniref:Uncharacterized protein n=1 Tax=Oryza nivara TaxID=4536 RepID=A0A0E0I1H5_ORYNI